MKIQLLPLREAQTIAFKEEMQEAFQHGFQSYYKDDNQWQVLPDKDFYQSLEDEGAEAYEAIDADGQRVGGAIISIDSAEHRGELSFLYVKVGMQSKGIGQAIWKAIETLHPEVEVWETSTPYFDRRNIHFYINRLGSMPSSSSTNIIQTHTCPSSLTRKMDCSSLKNAFKRAQS